MEGHDVVVNLLLEAGAKVNQADHEVSGCDVLPFGRLEPLITRIIILPVGRDTTVGCSFSGMRRGRAAAAGSRRPRGLSRQRCEWVEQAAGLEDLRSPHVNPDAAYRARRHYVRQ